MNASAINATPRTLNTTCNTNHALRPGVASASGVRPLRIASPRSPVASGAAKKETADPRSRRSLASCSSTRQSASIESAGPSPTGVSWETPMTCTAAPAHGNAMVSARGVARSPTNGANASAVASPYSASATRCRVTITANREPGPRRRAGGEPGLHSGRHLLDQSYRKTALEPGMRDLNEQTCGRVLARMHHHQHRANLLRGRTKILAGRLVGLEHV